MRKDLVWQTLIGFVGFFAFIAFIQAVVNLFRPEPAIWPGLLAGALVLATWVLTKRWLQWRSAPEPTPKRLDEEALDRRSGG